MPYPSDFFALRKPRVPMPSEAIDPGIDVGSGDIPTSAFSPALQPHSDAARSPTGGANGPGMSPMDPGHQYMSDLQDVSGRLSAALSAPRPGKFRQVMGAFIGNANPGMGGLISGETQRQRSIEPLQQEYGVLGQLINANRQQQLAQGTLDKDQATADYLRGKNAASENVATTRAGAITGAADTRAGASMYGADQRLKGTEMNLGPMADVPQELQEQFGLPAQLPLSQLNRAESAANKPLTVVQGQNGPAVVNKIQAGQGLTGGHARNLGIGSPSLGRAVQVSDPNNPGNITYASAGQAIRSGALSPQSAPAQTARQTARTVAPGGKVGEEINAFSTAIQHASLLRSAVTALKNGDNQSLNSLRNKFKTEFGNSGPITSQAIADAYQREITSMLSKGHITDGEISTVGKTLNVTSQSPEQSLGVIDAYTALANSKMNVRKKGVDAGMKGKANFPSPAEGSAGGGPAAGAATSPGSPVEGSTATGPNGHKIKFTQGKWVDASTGQPIQ